MSIEMLIILVVLGVKVIGCMIGTYGQDILSVIVVPA